MKILKKVIPLSLSMILLFCFIFSVPVFAASADAWLDDIFGDSGGGYSGFLRKIFDVSDQIFNDEVNDPSNYDDNGRFNPFMTNTQPTNEVPSGGGGTRGYYTAPGVSSGGLTGYSTGTTRTTSIVQRNTINNTYTVNMPTTINNNTTYNVKNTYYNQQYNTYLYQTTNNYDIDYNYYITYAPTYVNVIYLDPSGSGNHTCNFYYYELPDGRNSFNLKAEDVYGIVFNYDYVNYDLVFENSDVFSLRHFDGTLSDTGGDTTHGFSGLQSNSYYAVDTFGSSLYLTPDNKSFYVDVGSSSLSTVEFRTYFSPTSLSVPVSEFTRGGNFHLTIPKTAGASTAASYATAVNNYLDSDRFGNKAALAITETPGLTIGQFVRYSAYSAPAAGYPNRIITDYGLNNSSYVSAPLFSFNGVGYLPIMFSGTFLMRYTIDYVKNDAGTSFDCHFKLSFGRSPDDDAIFVEYPVPFGRWTSIAVSGDKLFIDGTPTGYASGSSTSSHLFEYYMNPSLGSMQLLDELRFSVSSLYSGSYTPIPHPFTDNVVLVQPSYVADGVIAIQSRTPVGKGRIGGARPSLPAFGDIYIYLDGKYIVKSAEIYTINGWESVQGSIGIAGEWVSLIGHDFSDEVLSGGDFPGGKDPTDPTDPTDPIDPTDPNFWDNIGKWLSSIGSAILGGLQWVGSGVTYVIQIFTNAVSGASEAVGEFGELATKSTAFLPPEIIALIVIGFVLVIVLAIIRFVLK